MCSRRRIVIIFYWCLLYAADFRFCFTLVLFCVFFLCRCFASASRDSTRHHNCCESLHICIRISNKNVCTTSRFGAHTHRNMHVPILIYSLFKIVCVCVFFLVFRPILVISECNVLTWCIFIELLFSLRAYIWLLVFFCSLFNCCCCSLLAGLDGPPFEKIAFWHSIIGM